MRVASECVEGYWLNHQVLTLETEICQNCSLFLNTAKLRIFPDVIAGVSSFAMSQFRYIYFIMLLFVVVHYLILESTVFLTGRGKLCT